MIEAIEGILVGGIGLTTRALTEAAEATDLTLRQWRMLVIVGDEDGVRIGELGRRLGVAEPSASRLAHRLEHHGLVTVERDDADRRATNVRLSSRGRQTRDLVLDRRRGLIGHATEGSRAGATGKEIRRLRLIADALAPFA
ncbi:MAG TPA: MarR family transcriptional regulator [Candidatus Limnocylindrales bacterium]|nr:MarR family transcriptional regulator [Candidatus Limnocylindrales bacterium]